MPAELTDYEWLVSGDAECWLRAAEDSTITPSTVARLRRRLPPERVDLIATQWMLRRKARPKFSRAEELFLESTALEQATDETIANYKAASLSTIDHVADLACGIGGDAMSFARMTRVTAVEIDPIRAVLVRANLQRHGTCEFDVRVDDALRFPLRDVDGWHIDPDRRSTGRRTTRADAMSPTRSQIADCLAVNPHALVKVAPASRVPDVWLHSIEQEWIGHARQCQQQLWRFGRFARYPGKRVATVLSHAKPNEPYQMVEQPVAPIVRITEVGPFLIEPHAAILAAGLADQFASVSGCQGFPSRVAYYTSDRPLPNDACSCYRVETSMPFDARSVRRWLRDHDAQIAAVKKRGVALEPTKVMKRLETPGQRELTLLIFPVAGSVVAVLAERCDDDR